LDKVRFEGKIDSGKDGNDLQKEETLRDRSIWKYYLDRKVRETAEGEQIIQYIYTTVGRVIYNKTIMDGLNPD
jgi:DNA-directed RNA polymerase subunit beta'